MDAKASKAFSVLVEYERPRRLASLLESTIDALHMNCLEYIASQPVRFAKDHPSFGQAARCGEILTGCDAKDVIAVHFDPAKEGPLRKGEIPLVNVMVATRDRRWHEVPDMTIDRLVGAWLDARQ
jgi:hypothetical protein